MLLMTKEKQENSSPEPMLSVEDVMKRLNVSRDMVTKLMKTGQLRYKKVGRIYRFREQWIRDYMNSEEGPAE